MKFFLAFILLFSCFVYADPLPEENACEAVAELRVEPEYPIEVSLSGYKLVRFLFFNSVSYAP
ncbi:hypothetical protein [Thalassomonas haliotis]|uniref:Uncharacterized protein n=1 Tax=Thalassomonas haliotis TaxID=485448 RepID=A0ABY7VDW1_9GAMM|nr:hypothetical protein [Thalassomonas haliotis]WDE11899.1 hypothetical protein H3N35_27560 [Thalassomonas haliotis]